MVTDWGPATPTEEALLAAAEAGDRDTLLATLATGPLLLPVSPEAAAGRAPAAWPTAGHDGRTHVIAFTSPEAIAACLPGQSVSYRVLALADLAADWPDDDWLLAIDAGLPIGVRLTAGEVRAIAAPALEAERELRDAIGRQEPDALMAALLRAELLLPLRPGGSESRDLSDPDFPWWCLPDEQGQPCLPVFTTEARLRQALGDHDLVAVSSLQLAEQWPDPSWQLLLNPGTPLAAALPGEAVRTLRDWLGQLRQAVTDATDEERQRLQTAAYAEPATVGVPAQRTAPDEDDDEYEPDPDLPVRLQLVIPHRYLPSYLEDGYQRAAGLVHAWAGPGRDTPTRLYRRLGLLGEGSPFAESDEWVAVLRWEPDEDTPEDWGRGQPRMESLVVPDGTGLHCLHHDGRDELLARFDAASGRWVPA
ncbi:MULTISPECIES: SseB family protein [unclassified Micromonospora]|uniref:SseB family protein n=1 Tax=unclassified Micromonospora TaxID=2617518 RepID=UPI00331C4D81